ncbi:MAG: N-6 DNA methylase [Candidatus Micrarchaeaceae archaeon]
MLLDKKKLEGATNTPPWIVDLILDKVGYTKEIISKRIIDPACGDGNFLTSITERFILECRRENISNDEIANKLDNNIYGLDINIDTLERCKKNLNEVLARYGIKKITWKNIVQADSLNEIVVQKFRNYFDFVVGNPPYIRIQNLDKNYRRKIQNNWTFCKSGSTDIYIAFFELGINLLNTNGKLGFITPKTFLKTEAGREIRSFLKKKGLIRELIDFNDYQIFEDATTYSAITILDKEKKNRFFDYYRWINNDIKRIGKIDVEVLNNDMWVLGDEAELKRIKEIETRGIPLGKIADIHAGIATLADDFYIFKNPVIRGNVAKITLKDGRSFDIEKNILKPIIKVSILKTAHDEQNRYIIFPYKTVLGKNIIIQEEELKKVYPLTYKYFLAVKDRLLLRDKGKKSAVWYAFGRSQGLNSSFGKKILVVPMSLEPRFIVWNKEEYTFYAGYCIKFNGNLDWLAKQLNSEDMKFYIDHVAREYTGGYKSYSKNYIKNFGIIPEKEYRQKAINQQLISQSF